MDLRPGGARVAEQRGTLRALRGGPGDISQQVVDATSEPRK